MFGGLVNTPPVGTPPNCKLHWSKVRDACWVEVLKVKGKKGKSIEEGSELFAQYTLEYEKEKDNGDGQYFASATN